MTVTRVGKACALAAVGAVIGACGNATPPSTPPSGPPPINYTHVWSAQPGIDLFSRGAELVRATFESGHYAEITDDVHKAYPGYGDALGAPPGRNYNSNGHDDDGVIHDGWWIHEPNLDTSGHASPATDHAYITDYSATATDIKAVVCDYALSPDPTVEDPEHIDSSYALELHNPTSDPGPAGIAQTAPGARDPRATLPPTWNVFGPWQITRLSTLPIGNVPLGPAPPGGGSPPPITTPQSCVDWWKNQLHGWDLNGHLYPPNGSTTPHEPLQPQYPQWIGPT